MKLIYSELVQSWRRYKFLFLSPRVLCHYTTTSSSETNYASPLYKRISIAGDPRVSVIPILDQWVQEGHEIDPKFLPILVNRLRNFRRFSHALQVSEWMKEKHSSSMSFHDTAIQLELTYKVHGLQAAEKYFTDLPHSSKNIRVFHILLNCYVTAQSVKKSEGLMQKMKKLGFADRAMPYNMMLKLYIGLENYDKVKQVMEEMETMGLTWNTFSYHILLQAHSNSTKVKEMERLLMKMEADPMHIMKYSDYVTAANGYLKAGVVDKSLVMLKRAENLANHKGKKHVYQILITLYANAKAKEEVFRIWNLYKKSFKVYNKGYHCMVSALVILEDIQGAEKIIDEWVESVSRGDNTPDSRVINSLIRAYGKKGDFERAEALIDRVRERSNKDPQRSTWVILTLCYQMRNKMEDSVKTMKKSLLADGRWLLNKGLISPCLAYLKVNGSAEKLEEFTTLLERCGYTAEDLLSNDSKSAQAQPTFDHQDEEEDMDSDDIIVGKAD